MSLALLNLDAAALRSLFERQELTSVELVKQVLAQIERHDKKGAKLNAMIAVAPEKDLLRRAAELDEERRAGKLRSRLHGIPLLVKVSGIRYFELLFANTERRMLSIRILISAWVLRVVVLRWQMPDLAKVRQSLSRWVDQASYVEITILMTAVDAGWAFDNR